MQRKYILRGCITLQNLGRAVRAWEEKHFFIHKEIIQEYSFTRRLGVLRQFFFRKILFRCYPERNKNKHEGRPDRRPSGTRG